MKKNLTLILASALILILFVSACAPQEEETPIVVATNPGLQTDTPSALETETLTTGTETTSTAGTPDTTDTTPTVDLTGTLPATTQTPGIPVTGAENILLECQYCIDNMAHTLLVFPDTATFELVSPAAAVTESGFETGCNAIDVFNGRQVVLCRAEENTSLTLNICTDANACAELQVDLQTCPDAAGTQPGVTDTAEPGVETNTPSAVETGTPMAEPTSTPLLTIPTATP